MRRPLRSVTLASLLVIVLALPYAGPAICTVTGRMDSNAEMPAGCPSAPASSAWATTGADGGHCQFGGCGVTIPAQISSPFTELPTAAVSLLVIAVLPTLQPNFSVSPPTPPPLV